MRRAILIFCAAGLTVLPAWSQERREGGPPEAAAAPEDAPERALGGRSGEMPSGLAQRETLPAGIERRVERKGELPRGLGKRFEPMVRRGVGGPGGLGAPGVSGGHGRARGRR